MSIPDDVQELLGPVVANLDAELIDVEYSGSVLRLVVDRDGGIDIDTLATINRVVSPMLDDHDPISGRYTLEVSSPGVERKLRRPDHFARAVGEQVLIKLLPGGEVRRLKGELVAAGEEQAELLVTEVDGVELEPERRTVDLAEVSSARTVFDWGPTPKPGSGSKRLKASGGSPKAKKSKKKSDKQGAPEGAHSEGKAHE